MSKQIATLGNNVPAHLKAANASKLNQAAATGTGGVSVNRIGIKGGKFRLIVNGEEVKVLEKNSIQLAIIRAADGVHKAYYAKKWVPGTDDAPDCSSDDGITPRADSLARQSKKCAGCPKNEWGSFVNPDTGAKGKLCSDSKRLAVLPPNQLGTALPPYQLQVPAASLKAFGVMLSGLNNLSPAVPYNAVVVSVAFDTEASYPKLVFSPVDYLDADQYAATEARYDSAETKQCLSGSLIDVVDVTDEDDDEVEAAPAPRKKAAAKPATVVEEEEEELEEEEEEEAPKPAPKPRARKKAAPKPVEEEAEEDDDDVFGDAPAEKPAPKTKAKPAATGFDDDEEEAEDASFTEVPKAGAKSGNAPKATADVDDVFGEGWD